MVGAGMVLTISRNRSSQARSSWMSRMFMAVAITVATRPIGFVEIPPS